MDANHLRSLFAHSAAASHDNSNSLPTWRSVYWFYAAIVPLAFYSFEALKVSLYHVARSPNLALPAHLTVILSTPAHFKISSGWRRT